MLKLGRVTKFKMLFLVLVSVFNLAYSNVFEFSAAILEKGLLAFNSFDLKNILGYLSLDTICSCKVSVFFKPCSWKCLLSVTDDVHGRTSEHIFENGDLLATPCTKEYGDKGVG